MKNKIINLLLSIFIISITIIMFFNANLITSNFIENFKFIVLIILPSLFPFMIFINFILNSNCVDYISLIFKPIAKIFKISGYGMTCLIASLLGGFPYSAIIVTSFLKENKISKNEADRLLISLSFPSISFLFATLYPLDNQCIYNIISLYISSFVVLYITSFFKKDNTVVLNEKFIIKNDFTNIYYTVMNDSIKAIISISFSIIFFKFFTPILTYAIKNEIIILLISGLFEFSSSSINILLLENKTLIHYIIFNIIISFSSFSILFQSLYYTKEINFGIKKLLLSRITISLISLIIFLLLKLIFK